MTTVDFTAEEIGALLRASRIRLEEMQDEMARLHLIGGEANRRLADQENADFRNLQSAVRKIWSITTK